MAAVTQHMFERGDGGGAVELYQTSSATPGLPVPMVQDDIRNGSLVHLDLPAYNHREYPIYAVSKIANPPGPAARWLIAEFQAELSRFAAQSDIPLPIETRSHSRN